MEESRSLDLDIIDVTKIGLILLIPWGIQFDLVLLAKFTQRA
jgi:hypothetical protein